MNLFAGLEKFGFKNTEHVDLFAEQKPVKQEKKKEERSIVENITEEDCLLEKTIRCTVCDKAFKTIVVKAGRVKRMEPDFDLRPRHLHIDTLKYDVSSCPFCGYTAMNRYFEHLTGGQIKLIREQITKDFSPEVKPQTGIVYDYEKAIDMHKLSLLNAIVKRARTSERAYNCLVISWLLRAKIEQLEEKQLPDEQLIENCRKEASEFYIQAYEGLVKAMSTELYPICGMDQSTMDYLIASMSVHLKKYDIASKTLANVITSPTAGRKLKEKAIELKEEIIRELRNTK